MRDMVAEDLRSRGFEVSTAASGEHALAELERAPFDAVLADLRMPGLDGIELCGRIAARWPETPAIVMTAFGSLDTAVEALHAGAYDFITKPVDLDVLALALRRAVEHRELRQQVRILEDLVPAPADAEEEMIGRSEGLQRVRDRIERVAGLDSSVLVLGETGTGKELVARALHRRSPRRDAPFVAVNCAALPASLLESELFGHVRGAFTGASGAHRGVFEQAHGGTLFLDEIGEFTENVQVKLLRVLEQGRIQRIGSEKETPVDVRLITATNRDLDVAAEQGAFRRDLLFRIDVVRIELPPLRARETDCLLLGQHFIGQFAEQTGRPVQGLAESAARRLLEYPWPGNVRELRNAMEAAVAVTRHERVLLEDLPGRVRAYQPVALPAADVGVLGFVPLREMEERYIRQVLEAVDGNKSAAAELLGLDRKTLYRKLHRHGIL